MPRQVTSDNAVTSTGQLPPEDLTLDVCILITGSRISDDNTDRLYGEDCLSLMKRMVTQDKYHLALDSRNMIQAQYDTKLSPDRYGHYFVRQMATMGKTVTIPWQPLNTGIRVQLHVQGFTRDSEDYKFVVVSSCTCCKKLVSHERHFFNVQRILSRIGITVLLPANA